MKHRLIDLSWALLAGLLVPARLLAASSDDEVRIDARLENFTKGVKVEEASSALTWLLLIFLTLICVAVLFKNAKRTHLD